ncbi:acyltransferase [Terrimonas sp. NA20]|uniref:Acyltransferase n=1 Tax=Terrimonas ginsenosidimutans TaxID=2908004 RepID=A0ABS9KX16_9BACT|nr:acyltransferase [Terrimonas ginsenosidimutans]MCG2616861.1 acyltransferase [Terrimonas ginsenosidimutans]
MGKSETATTLNTMTNTTTTRSLKDRVKALFNFGVLERERFPWVDYLRGIAIILVVYRHVLIGLERGSIHVPTYLATANEIFYSFRMPLFFILSGLFINSSIGKRTLSRLFYFKFENLFYPYLVWAFIQVTIQIVLSSYSNSHRSLIDYTYIFYQPRALDQLWYLPALFNTTIIYILVKTKLKPPSWLQLIIGLTTYLLSPYFDSISMISDWMEFYLFFALGDVISTAFFNDKFQQFLKSKVVLLCVTPVFIATQVFYLNYHKGNMIEFLLIALIGCFYMFILAFRMQEWKILPVLRVFGYHSLYIYVMHVMIAAFTRTILTKAFGIDNSIVLLIIGIAAGIIIPIIIFNLFVKDGFAWRLFYLTKPGLREKKKQTEVVSTQK